MKDTSHSSPNQPKESNYKGGLQAYRIAAGQVWYLVHCKPNSEKIALRNLKNQDFPAFLPLQKLTRRNGAVFQTRLHPLFPSYMFVAQDPAAGQWRKINNTRGVARIVCLAAEPSPVPMTIMNQLFEQCDVTGVFQKSANLAAGDNAKISQGSFAGAIGEIIAIEPNQRVHLILDFMGQKSNLKIDRVGVTPIS